MKKSNYLMMLVAGMMLFSVTGYAMSTDATPVHRPLLEEYTGTWCGWCVRGLVGMELCSETFGDNFIGVAYHYGDAMQTINPNAYPNDVGGFPTAFLERAYDIDPYYGFGSTSAGILNDLSDCAAQAVTVDLAINAQWTSEAKTEISVEVSTYSTVSTTNGRYALEIMLVADDLYGSGSSWNQYNYYSGYTQVANDPYLGPYVRKSSTLTGIHFNDVLLATSGVIEGSVPRNIVAYEDYIYNYNITLSTLPVPSLVQNKDNLRVVVIIVDVKNGKAVNANKGYISDYVEPVVVVPGDVNEDGLVNITDVTVLIDYLLYGDSISINFANADMDGNETINITDVTALIDYLLFH